jgi:Uncharacterised nucleotidyltransferase
METPFGNDFLRAAWPLLLQSCALPRDPVKISALAAEVDDVESLFRLADEHGVIAHLAAALATVADARIPPILLDSLRTHRRLQLLLSLTMTAELFRILELFRMSQIECIVVKGPVLSLRAYGDAAARQYVDLDLLIRHSDIRRTAEILTGAGYESRVPAAAIRAGRIPGEYLFRRPDTKIVFELHTQYSFRYFPLPLPIETYFQHRVFLPLDGQSVPALSSEHEFVLIAIHGAKHFWERLMWISDVAAMAHNRTELNWKSVRRSAADVGAERMVRVALLLSERLLGVPVPAEMKDDVARDSLCPRLVDKIAKWLPYGGAAAPSLAQRAWFRFKMRGDVLSGAAYLARLSFSTTEEDWSHEAGAPTSRVAEALRRPFRLARKYRRNPDS